MVKIITVEREYGSGAGAIASKLAQQTGFELWDQAISTEIARRLRCDVRAVEQREEKPDPTFYRLFKTFMRGSYEDRVGSQVEMLDADGLATLFETVIGDIAKKGNCVIVGRAAPWFLRGRADTYSVFLYASPEEKMRRTLAAGRSKEEAEDLLERVDRDRAAFVKKYHNMSWPTRWLYHLMINTAMGDDAVVDLILSQAKRL